MLRGSKPGERRGGRARGTPNRRSVLAARLLAIGLDHPGASRTEFFQRVIMDPRLPADTRMAVAPRCFPAKRSASSRSAVGIRKTTDHACRTPAAIRDWSPNALDALLSVIQDAGVNAKTRRRAALKFAEFMLPKTPKKPRTLSDEFGFSVSPKLLSVYRDISLKRRALLNASQRTRKTPVVAQQIATLQIRLDALLKRCQVPCPSKYSRDLFEQDVMRIMDLAELRAGETGLSDAEEAEEAHVRIRCRVFSASPEVAAWHRLKTLEDAERAFKKAKLLEIRLAKPLSRLEQNELEVLRRLYVPQKEEREIDDALFVEMLDYHPFRDEWPSSDGSFYRPDSKVRPRGVITDVWSGSDRPRDPPSRSSALVSDAVEG